MVLGYPKPRPARIWTVAAALILGLCMLMLRRWTGIIILAMSSLAVISRAPEGLAAAQRSLSHWRQSIKQLTAAAKEI